MTSTTPILLVCAFSIAGWQTLSAAESELKPVKTRLVPRPVPGLSSAQPSTQEQISRKPVTGFPVGMSGQSDNSAEKAHIGAIRRARLEEPLTGKPSEVGVGEDLIKSVSGREQNKVETPALRPGQIRVVPKADVRAAVGGEVTAQKSP